MLSAVFMGRWVEEFGLTVAVAVLRWREEYATGEKGGFQDGGWGALVGRAAWKSWARRA